MAQSPQVGQRNSYGGALCTVRYIGEVAGTAGAWLGVEWDDATRGKHDGSHKGGTSRRALDGAAAAFPRVDELALGETLLGWEELCRIATRCPSLTTWAVGANRLSSLPFVDYAGLAFTLTSINLEYNDFNAISDLASLTGLVALRNLHLKGNNIVEMAAPDTTAPTFPPSVRYLDISYNKIRDWSFVDALSTHFPGLAGLRIAHNPVYDSQDAEAKTHSTEESHMLTIGRFASLKSVNFTQVKPEDRRNAEVFYLSRIAKQLATVSESAEHTILALHPRYAELCTLYGEPDVIRRDEVNPSFLEARLVTVGFHCRGRGKKTWRIPKAFDIYSVRGVAGKLFGLSPLRVRLIWETGEWDPVANDDEQDVESSDEEDEEEQARDGSGRWLPREIELKDGPKQLGYCVDGLDVIIRVESA
ncbi:Cytoskeleton-associated protein, Gly-rich domain protein [Ophiocordyceps sinensis CO18]|uniref:Cytoskeleton-associated protein, Gly-rich domain protein n=1 Tax=Ophiocordyceps sinensis (strain Co18 / CGMCC 3.14243) TaxID=911162 RepID=T5AE15_OPHSC|nr:Cytoskeleton-associated protein, Gly-rich domain protein [Ophiocordyceps sinensis CO18]